MIMTAKHSVFGVNVVLRASNEGIFEFLGLTTWNKASGVWSVGYRCRIWGQFVRSLHQYCQSQSYTRSEQNKQTNLWIKQQLGHKSLVGYIHWTILASETAPCRSAAMSKYIAIDHRNSGMVWACLDGLSFTTIGKEYSVLILISQDVTQFVDVAQP